MIHETSISVTKIDAARRQLNTAIALWFADGDPVSVQTLAYASHEILHRLFKGAGLSDLLYDASWVKDEYRSEFAALIHAPANFFKHANRQSQKAEEQMEFHPASNRLLLLVSISAIERMGYELTAHETAMATYIKLHDPSKEFASLLANHGTTIDHIRGAETIPRSDFLGLFIELFERGQRS